MKFGPDQRTFPIFMAISGLFVIALLAWGVISYSQTIPDSNASGPNALASAGPTLGPNPSPEGNSQIPDSVASAQSMDQQAQADALKAEEEKAAAQEQEIQQMEQAPLRFECTVTGIRIGENRSLLKVNVSAPNEIPEVWVGVNTERGDLDGKVVLLAGQGEQIIPLRNPSPGFRPTIKVYSLPVLTEQYEMCSFR
jgi:hypothetical protein